MIGKFLIGATLAAAAAAPALGAVTVIGNSAARLCYEAAEARIAAGRDSLLQCDAALSEDTLGERDRVATYVNRGILKMHAGNFDAAVQDFDRAIARDPQQAEAYLNKGLALLRAGHDSDEVIALFGAALEKRTRRPAFAYYGRAVAYETKGRLKEAWLD